MLKDLQDYADYIGEQVVPWSYGKFPYAKSWGEGFSLDLENPKGIYRANTLARINVADKMATPRAQAELEEFRSLFGRPAQATLLYHYARLIEAVYACEHAIELLEDASITDTDVRARVEPRAGWPIPRKEWPLKWKDRMRPLMPSVEGLKPKNPFSPISPESFEPPVRPGGLRPFPLRHPVPPVRPHRPGLP